MKARKIDAHSARLLTAIGVSIGLGLWISLFTVPAAAQGTGDIEFVLRSGSVDQKRSALAQLRNLRTADASRLAAASLIDTNEMVRATAASAVVFLPEDEAVSVLNPLLSDKNEFVRKEGCYALAAVGSPLAAPFLIRLLEREKSLEVKSAAIIALGLSGNESALDILNRVLRSKPSEKTEFIRRSAARAIGQIVELKRTGHASYVTPKNFLPEGHKDLDAYAAGYSSEQQTASVGEILMRILQDPKESADTRREAAFALGAIADPASLALLERTMSSSDPYLAEISKEAILRLRTQK